MLKHFLSQINEKWLDQSDDEWSYMIEVAVCKELGEILKKEGFDKPCPHTRDFSHELGHA